MTYAFQLQGLIVDGVVGTFDYSRFALAPLNEGHLSEVTGIGAGAAGYGTRRYCAGQGFIAVIDATAAIDWNCNAFSNEPDVPYDVNASGALAILTGYEDWPNVRFKEGAIGVAGELPELPAATETDLLTVEVARETPPAPPLRPIDVPSLRCEKRLVRAVTKQARAVAKCQVKFARTVMAGKSFDEAACAQAAQAKYDAAGPALVACPSCVVDQHRQLGTEFARLIHASNGMFYCDGATPLGDDIPGFVPVDRTNAQCAAKFLASYATLLKNLLMCQVKRASASLGNRTFDNAGCRTTAVAKYDAATAALAGCGCVVTNQSMLREDIQRLLDENASRFFCSGAEPMG